MKSVVNEHNARVQQAKNPNEQNHIRHEASTLDPVREKQLEGIIILLKASDLHRKRPILKKRKNSAENSSISFDILKRQKRKHRRK